MRKSGFLFWGIIGLLFATGIVFADEVYVSTVVLEGKWGDKPGEFGLALYDNERTTITVSAMFVTNNDKVYILDSANLRVQQFDAQGRLENIIPIQADKGKKEQRMDFTLGKLNQILVDRTGDIYIAAWGEERNIKKYNKEGVLIKQWDKHKFEKLFGRDSFGEIGLVNGEYLYFLVYQEGFIRRYLWQDRDLFEPLGKGVKGTAGEIRYSFLENPDRADTPYETWVQVLDKNGIVVGNLQIQAPPDIRDEMVQYGISTKFLILDKKNLIYLLVTIPLEQARWEGERCEYVYKYSVYGGLYAKIKLANVAAWSGGETNQHLVSVTDQGNVYELFWSPTKGVKLIKWHRPKKESKIYEATKPVEYDPFEQ